MKHCLTPWSSKLPRSFEIQGVRQFLVNFTGLAGIVNAPIYKTQAIFTSLRAWQIALFFNTQQVAISLPDERAVKFLSAL